MKAPAHSPATGTVVCAILAVMALWSGAPGVAEAATILTFTPEPSSDIYDLDHYWVYEWGIDVLLDPSQYVSGAELFFNDISNWDAQANDLYVHLLDWATKNLSQHYDGQGGADYFVGPYVGQHTHLVTYHNLPSTPQDLTYTFEPSEVAAVNTYLADDRIGIGLDPDCHYFNTGIELRLTVVPEPASLALLGAGGLTLLGQRR